MVPPQPPPPSATAMESTPKKLAPSQLNFAAAASTAAPVRPDLQLPSSPIQPLLVNSVQHSSLSAPRPVFPVVVVKAESPNQLTQTGPVQKDATTEKQKQCNCKNSRCLKLYCSCFSSGIYCDGCNCTNCHNNVEHETSRQEAVGVKLERNPNAFRPKIANSPHRSQESKGRASRMPTLAKHNKGCNCKRSSCLKKYCECFQANIFCSENCKCLDCKNSEGSEERRALLHANQYNTLIYMATNTAINGAIGSSGFWSLPTSKKRKHQDIMFDTVVNSSNNAYRVPACIQENENNFALPRPASSSPNTRKFRSSKVKYRSPLADILKTEDVEKICSLLVSVAAQAEQTYAAKESKLDLEKQQMRGEINTSTSVASEDKLNCEGEIDSHKQAQQDGLTAAQAERPSGDGSGSDGSDLHDVRPTSPSTLALMCDEEASELTEVGPSNELGSHGGNTALKPFTNNQQDCTELYVEQERLVLSKFRDCLNRIITFGSIKETMCSPVTTRDPVKARQNSTLKVSKQVKCEKGHMSNSAVNPLQAANEMAHKMASASSFPRNGWFRKLDKLPIRNGLLKPKTEKEP